MQKKIIILISTFTILIALGLSVYFTNQAKKIPENSLTTVGNTAGNLYNGGYFCQDEEYVYFSNPYDNYALYRMLPDETKMEKLVSMQIKQINSAGKYLYYYQYGSGANSAEGLGSLINMVGVYRCEKKKPKENSCIELTRLDNLILAGNNLYYDANDQNGVYLKEASLDGKTITQLTDYKITAACADNGKLYFHNTTTNFYLQSLNLTTKQISDVLKEDVYMPIVDGNEVFYIDIHNHYALVKYNLVTAEKIVLDETRTDMFNLSDRYVYYQTAGDQPQFKRIARNGSDMQVVADGAYNTFQITSNYVYFRKFQSELPVYKIPLDGSLAISTFDAANKAAVENAKK